MDPGQSFRVELDGLDPPQVQVLSLDQIQSIRANNDYVDRPVALEPATGSGFFLPAHEDRIYFTPPQPPPPFTHFPRSQSHHLSRSSTVSSMSRTSAASDQRLLFGLTPSNSATVRSQPKGGLKSNSAPSFVKGLVGEEEAELGLHLFICERCGRCKCAECVAPRPLPSCWACGQRCVCSAENAVEYGTCLCCVKCLFYHCSAQDDDENCADRPCSCGAANAAARWGAMAVLALCLPCLCCYPPARLGLALCRCAHDRMARPGCRCSNTNTVCRKISASNPNAGHPKAPEKPL